MRNIVGFLHAQTRREPSHQAKLAFLVVIIALSMVLPGHSVHASITPPFGTVLVSGNQWLGGQGVDVHWNNFATSGPSSGYGTEWQCVELAQRLYKQRGWYSGYIFPNTGSAYQIYDNAPSMGFIRHANGDGVPVPGDMIIHAGTSTFTAGHVDVVDYVAGGVVHVVEQNTSSVTGRASYTLSGSTMLPRPGFGTIRGYVHAPGNHLATPPPPPPAPSSKIVGEARRPDGTMDVFVRGTDGSPYHLWLDANGNLIRGYESLGGSVQGAMVGSWTADGKHLDVFGVGTDNSIYRDRLDSPNTSFNGWTLVPGGGTAGSPTVGEARRPDGTMDVFVRGTDGSPYHLWLDANGNLIRGYESLGGSVQGAMVGSWTADGKHLDVFGVGTDNSIYRDHLDSPNTSFNGWTLVPGGGTAG